MHGNSWCGGSRHGTGSTWHIVQLGSLNQFYMLLLFLILDVSVREIYSRAYGIMEQLCSRQSLWVVTLVFMFLYFHYTGLVESSHFSSIVLRSHNFTLKGN